jgi:segregation and condensation protein B
VTGPDPVRVIEAVLFAAAEPIADAELAAHLPDGADLPGVLADLSAQYETRGVNLVRVAEGWAFRTAPDLAGHFRIEKTETRRLSRAAVETLAVVAYHQPVTRAEIEAIRGVAVSKGTLDVLLEAGWVRPGKRRQTPGRPLTWVTTPAFLDHFGLGSRDDLPGLAELKAAGLLEAGPAMAVLPGGRADELTGEEEPESEGGADAGGDDAADDASDFEEAMDFEEAAERGPGADRGAEGG